MQKIMVGFDGSDESRDALHLADRIARLETAELHVVAAGLFEPQISTRVEERDAKDALRELFAGVEDELGPRRYSPRTIEGLPASRAVLRLAETEGFDLIVVGSTHRGAVGRVLPGSFGAQLLHGAPCPVAVSPRGFRSERERVFGVIGVAYDGGHEAELALREAERLARMLEVRVELIGVVPIVPPTPLPPPGADSFEALQKALAEVLEGALAGRDPEVFASRLIEGDPGQALVERSAEVDLLVLGSRARGALRRTVLGSVSAHVISNAACPIVVVPRGAGE